MTREEMLADVLRRFHRSSCYPDASSGEIKIGVEAVLAALKPDGAVTSASRDENRTRYPKNWESKIVPRIRVRSKNQCECSGQCGQHHFNPRDKSVSPPIRCQRINGEIGYYDKQTKLWTQLARDASGLDMRAEVADLVDSENVVEIVLTVMHLDHQPENCGDDNLLHVCQGCRNRIKARRKATHASGDLFQGDAQGIRAAVIEECAKVADARAARYKTSGGYARIDEAQEIAKDIRALSATKPEWENGK